MPEQFTVLDNVSEFGQTMLEQSLKVNLVSFLEWGFLNIGGFANVRVGASGTYGGSLSELRPVQHPNYQDGRVWEAFRGNWVWETGLNYSQQPIGISGVFINSIFYPTATSGNYSYKLNYPLGYVIFASSLPLTSQVNLEYSYKKVTVQGDTVPWFREMMSNSYRPDDPSFNQFGSGHWNSLASTRLQYPAVIVEVAPQTNFQPAAIGGHFYRDQDVIFHAFAENPGDANKIRDIIKAQENKTIYLFDVDRVNTAGRYPLFMNGSVNPSAYMYPQLLNPPPEGFRYTRAYFKKVTPSNSFDNIHTHITSIRTTFRVDFFKGD